MTSFKSLCSVYFLIFFVLHLQMTTSGTIAPSASASRNLFAADLFQTIVDARPRENVIYSPASIQACVALAYLGAEGITAQEMANGLRLGSGNKEEIAQNYGQFLQTAFKSENGVELKMANGIFVSNKLQLAPKFEELAVKSFKSMARPMDFADAASSVGTINEWVEKETNSKIKNLLSPDSVGKDTSAVLVNALYFKAKWEKQFSKASTHQADFKLNSRQSIKVEMMSNDDKFKYGDFSDLDATAVELPYENSDLSMLVLLPKKTDGLQELENKLKGVDLNTLVAKMQIQSVDVFLPKFKMDFEIDLKEPLRQLGISTLFTNEANLSSLFTTRSPQKVSEARHKAYLEVNEAGSEAAAATFMKIVPMSLNLDQKVFRADHPFVFAIHNSQAVFFAGHLAQLK